MAEAHIPFSHMVVGRNSNMAHMTGSLQECRLWVLAKGLRAHTDIIPF